MTTQMSGSVAPVFYLVKAATGVKTVAGRGIFAAWIKIFGNRTRRKLWERKTPLGTSSSGVKDLEILEELKRKYGV